MRVGVFKDDLYVELRVIGMPHDAATQSSPHTNNTACLVLNQDFSFDVKFPELAVLMVLLKDQDSVLTDTVLGYAALPLANLAEGEPFTASSPHSYLRRGLLSSQRQSRSCLGPRQCNGLWRNLPVHH